MSAGEAATSRANVSIRSASPPAIAGRTIDIVTDFLSAP